MRNLHQGASFAIERAMLGAGLAARGGAGSGSPDSVGKIELPIGTFTNFGYDRPLPEYERRRGEIEIIRRGTGEGGPYRQNLPANSGLANAVVVKEWYFSGIGDKSSEFTAYAARGDPVFHRDIELRLGGTFAGGDRVEPGHRVRCVLDARDGTQWTPCRTG